jgi:hypothetical protein
MLSNKMTSRFLLPGVARRARGIVRAVGLVWLLGSGGVSPVTAGDLTTPNRVFSHPFDPREHPDYGRHWVKPPSWDVFGGQTHFTTLRYFDVRGNQVVGYRELLDQYSTNGLGDVVWPAYPILYATNLADLTAEIAARGMYVMDIWGYLPGSGPGYWQQFPVLPETLQLLETTLSNRWMGMNVGEQDGRYISSYVTQMDSISTNRFEQYLNLHQFFDGMGEALGDRLNALVTLNFGHYIVREGTYSMIGAETAQALPNSQVYYAFIRGAAKQYGVPWFGSASVYNRWGWKSYGWEGTSGARAYGPTNGASLSLLKRLMYSHILYNSMMVGLDVGWFGGNQFSPTNDGQITPLGQIQQAAQAWVKQYGQPGVLHTPVALLLDFYSGWSFPRHFYSYKAYRVWGNLPYGPGDYLTDGVLDMLYPGYQNSSYYHDESGFLCPTPYGDVADCLLSDAPGWLLARYPVLIVAGELSGGNELRDKLETYTQQGGHLVTTAGNLAKFPGGVAGVRYTASGPEIPRRLVPVTSGTPGVVEVPYGKGIITVFPSPFGLTETPPTNLVIGSEIDRPLPKPYPLSASARSALDQILLGQRLFDVGSRDLFVITCRKGAGDYTLGVFNNSWQPRAYRIAATCGPIVSIQELPLDQSEKSALGYLPPDVDPAAIGQSGEGTLAGGDLRLFAVQVAETNVSEIAYVPPPPRPKGRILPLRHASSIESEILARPTFFQHFDGVLVDWNYLFRRERAVLRHESRWIKLQRLRILVDLSSGLNLYPDLRLLDNLAAEYQRSLAAINDVIDKMGILGAQDLVFSLHRFPDTNFTTQQATDSMQATISNLCQVAAAKGITLHLRLSQYKPPVNVGDALDWLARINAPNLRLAANTAVLLTTGGVPPDQAAAFNTSVGLWLLGAPRYDVASKPWTTQAPPGPKDLAYFQPLWALAPDAPVVLDAVFPDQDSEYDAIKALEGIAPTPPSFASP